MDKGTDTWLLIAGYGKSDVPVGVFIGAGRDAHLAAHAITQRRSQHGSWAPEDIVVSIMNVPLVNVNGETI